MSEPAIRVEGLIKIYKTRKIRFRALCGIDLEVPKGEFTAVCGTSGSGKSTLLNLIAGLEPPTSGKIFVNGMPIHKMCEDELVDFRLRNTGFIFQNFNLFADLSALENVAFPLMLRGISKKKRDKRAKALLDDLGLAAHLHHMPGELSGGQQQRVSIARALVTRPNILFADEPTGNLDSDTADSTMQLLQDVAARDNATLLMVTHDMEKALRADRIVHIADGGIVKTQVAPYSLASDTAQA